MMYCSKYDWVTVACDEISKIAEENLKDDWVSVSCFEILKIADGIKKITKSLYKKWLSHCSKNNWVNITRNEILKMSAKISNILDAL
jgi:hypothetical protein